MVDAKNASQVAVIGGGIIGLTTAWQLSRNGFDVTVFEKDQLGSATSWVAAGMLAPHAELKFEEVEMMHLGEYSLGLYPDFLNQLKADLGRAPVLDRCGTILTAVNRDDVNQIKRFYQFRDELNIKVEWLTGSEAREKEPLLSPRIASAIWLPEDAQIDNRALLKDLEAVLLAQKQTIKAETAISGVQKGNNGKWHVYWKDGGSEFDKVIISTGPWKGWLDESPLNDEAFGFRPVQGEIIGLGQTEACRLNTMVRTPRSYLVPKKGGPLLLGATSYEKGFDFMPVAGGVKDLLEFGYEVIPAIYDLPYYGTEVGLRPATKDNSPVIGESEYPNLYWAMGHYRHGFLLAPATAFSLKDLVLDRCAPSIIQNFEPERFEA